MRMTNQTSIVDYALAGRAVISLYSNRTGFKRTYRIRAAQGRYFVDVLAGPENTRDFRFLGTLFDGKQYHHSNYSRVGKNTESVRGFVQFWEKLMRDDLPDTLEVRHEGRCGRCGRRLTDPDSIELGIGPFCLSEI